MEINNIKLQTLEISNFRNIEHLKISFESGRSAIYGKNAIGKTNVLEAISWLLTGKSLSGSSDEQANKPHNKPNACVSVKAYFTRNKRDGLIYEKQYQEVWEVSRGNVKTRTLKGHTTKYIINGVDIPLKKDAEILLNEYFGYNGDYAMLINPLWVEISDYKVLREIVIKLAGDIDNEALLESSPTLQSHIQRELEEVGGDVPLLVKNLATRLKTAKNDISNTKLIMNYITSAPLIAPGVKERLVRELKEKQDAHIQSVSELEIKQVALEQFIALKYQKLNENIAQTFGEVKFNLIESNIKEGSFKEVCYPYIIGKQTKFEKGSTSEKVITGIAVIEALKRKGNLPDLPIIFDEGEALDSESIATKIKTNAQVITAKVSDLFHKIEVGTLREN